MPRRTKPKPSVESLIMREPVQRTLYHKKPTIKDLERLMDYHHFLVLLPGGEILARDFVLRR